MWCGVCQQDVPGVVASANDFAVCCARCGKPLLDAARRRGSPQSTPAFEPPSGEPSESVIDRVPFEELPEFIELEDWEFEETIQEAERLVRRVTNAPQLGIAGSRPVSTAKSQSSQFSTVAEHASNDKALEITPPRHANTTIPWSVVATGLAVFVCGAALIGISLATERPQLWQLGLPMVLGGQVAVLAVVIWQLDVVWSSHRATFVALHAMDEQIRQLRELYIQTERIDDQPFYRHLAEGASPDVLLADLKDQIDMLSMRLVRDKHAA